jgi:hypothetical protein
VDDIGLLQYPSSHFIHAKIPLHELTPHLTIATLKKIARLHGSVPGSHSNKKSLQDMLHNHSCPRCNVLVTVFSIETPKPNHIRVQQHRARKQKKSESGATPVIQAVPKIQSYSSDCSDEPVYPFPPVPLTAALAGEIVAGACQRMSRSKIEEGGCAVCGELVPIEQLSIHRLKAINNHLHVLKAEGVSCIARKNLDTKRKEYTGPILDYTCNSVCNSCCTSLRVDKVPRLALAHGLWL